jgi:hypothetical protein
MILNRLKSIWTNLKFNSHNCYTKCDWDCNQGRNCTCTISFTPAMIEVHSLANKVPNDIYSTSGMQIRIELLQIEQRIAQLGNEYYERRNSETQH